MGGRQVISWELFNAIIELLALGGTYDQIARRLRVSKSAVGRVARGKHCYQQPIAVPKPRRSANQYSYIHDPTPDEVDEMCLEIQEGWNEKTEQGRRVTKQKLAEFPVVEEEWFRFGD